MAAPWIRQRAARTAAALAAGLAAAVVAASCFVAPSLAANALLHPTRRVSLVDTPEGCVDTSFQGEGVTLRGWQCGAAGRARATIVLLHGIADNRASWRAAIERLLPQGYEVVAYDSRANGQSDGAICTYGILEKADLHRVIDVLGPRRVVLVGASLGAAVALQEAPDDPRVVAVVAAEPFSDLRTVAIERAPRYLTRGVIRRAFARAEDIGLFRVDDASPVDAAKRIHVPVLLIHGAADADTPSAHSQRILDALQGPKRLILVPRAGHNHSLSQEFVWQAIDRWIDQTLGPSMPLG